MTMAILLSIRIEFNGYLRQLFTQMNYTMCSNKDISQKHDT